MDEFKYEITERIAVLSEKGKWTKELNKVKWNDGPEKYDLRDWNHPEGKMRKGTTLTLEELSNLRQVLNALNV